MCYQSCVLCAWHLMCMVFGQGSQREAEVWCAFSYCFLQSLRSHERRDSTASWFAFVFLASVVFKLDIQGFPFGNWSLCIRLIMNYCKLKPLTENEWETLSQQIPFPADNAWLLVFSCWSNLRTCSFTWTPSRFVLCDMYLPASHPIHLASLCSGSENGDGLPVTFCFRAISTMTTRSTSIMPRQRLPWAISRRQRRSEDAIDTSHLPQFTYPVWDYYLLSLSLSLFIRSSS